MHVVRIRDDRLLSGNVPAWIGADSDAVPRIITDDLADPDTATTLLWSREY